ncbi:MAG: four helix bundle protein [Bacteroidia bacterium]
MSFLYLQIDEEGMEFFFWFFVDQTWIASSNGYHIQLKSPMKKQELEDRLVNFSIATARSVEKLPKTFTNMHLGKQIIRSTASAALNYGEAQGAESRADFIHKMQIALKELKESFVCSKIIIGLLASDTAPFSQLKEENNELIAIFTVSIKTAKSNR